MIFFPFLYKDEILYSALARYHQYTGNENPKKTMDELFGSETICAATILPTNISALSLNLPIKNTYSPDYFIENHTFLPYYRPFIPQERFKDIYRLMVEGTGTSLYMKLGRTATTIKSPENLKYCIQCVEEDRSNFGESFWHRTHQAEGVILCHKHHTWLIESITLYSNRKHKHEFIPLEQSLKDKQQKVSADAKELYLNHLKYISEQSHYLLNNLIESFDLNKLKAFYIKQMQQRELATVSGRIRWLDFIPAFTKFYGEELLRSLNCFIELNQEDTWLHKILRKPRVSSHPLRHLLLMGFLGETISSVVSDINNSAYKPFGNGPWLCLNKAAEHYGQPVISSCLISRDYKTKMPVGTFSCSCGFVYSRKGPDRKKDDDFKIGRIKNFGEVWEQKLLDISRWDISLRKKAEILGVDPMTVKKRLDAAVQMKKNEKKSTIDKNSYRDQWIEIIEDNINSTITELRYLKPNVYIWLYRNDREWFLNNYPKVGKKNGPNARKQKIDWNHRDKSISREVVYIVEEIMSDTKEGKLIRVSLNEIGRRLGNLAMLSRNLDKMPLTKKLLDETIESIEQFQIRRVKYVVENLKKVKSGIQEWEVIRLAGLKKKTAIKMKEIILELLNG